MNAHMIRIVEGPLAGDLIAANDPVFDRPRSRRTNLTLVPAPAIESTTNNAESAKTIELDDYVLGGYAGI